MNKRGKKTLSDFERALDNLKIACNQAQTELEIDGTIKRFELCYELGWKLIKEYLADLGLICKNPRDCFKQAYNNDLIANKEHWLKMIEDRNLLVHTYNFANSRSIFENIHNMYLDAFYALLRRIKDEG